MGPRTFWSIVLILVLGVGTIWLLTIVKNEAGDPLLCTNCYFGGHHHHASETRRSHVSLKTLTSAQADFRANDRDGDGVHQFWRGDVAGLYTLCPPGGSAIKLIELSVAAADDRPIGDLSRYAVRSQKGGYWYRAIRHADEDPKALDPDRFAYCAFPDTSSAGKYLFIVDENNTIFRAPTSGRRGIEVYPTDEELRTQWAKID